MVVLVVMVAVGPPPLLIAMAATNSAPWTDAGLFCDFEDDSCNWDWSGFVVQSATEINASLWTSVDPTQISGPIYDDADGNAEGTTSFLSLVLLIHEIDVRVNLFDFEIYSYFSSFQNDSTFERILNGHFGTFFFFVRCIKIIFCSSVIED